MAAEKPGSKGQAWFCTTGLPSDVVIEVDEMSFHLHKFPLMSRSKKLHLLISEQEQDAGGSSSRGREVKALTGTPGAGSEGKGADGEEQDEEGDAVEEERGEEEEIEEEEPCHIALPGFPCGADTFEAAAKFCYGVKLELTPWNVAPLRCAAEYLEMTEEFSEDNLISRCERFFGQSILRSLRDSVRTLKSCEDLMPLAETLGIPQRCVDAIAVRACSIDPSSSLFGWPMNERTGGVGASDRRVLASHPVLWNGIDTGLRRKHHEAASNRSTATADGAAAAWFDDLAILGLPLFKRAIAAMKARGLSREAIEGCLISYARRSIPGLSRSSRKSSSGGPLPSESEQRELLETVIADLPLEKTTATSARFLFGLLRTVNILRASEASREILERKIASQLDRASLDDLLMPSYSYLVETLYDVDCVERILGYFLEGLQDAEPAISAAEEDEDEMEGDGGGGGGRARSPPSLRPLMMVGKLVDGYLSEIASDANLEPEKFCDLALVLPDHARVYDDGLYRAVDVYLKAHPRISELERERVCSVMDYQKLTLEACTHAAQNERLPLRAIVQVLFFEQLQLRHAIAGSLLSADLTGGSQPPESARAPRFHDEALAHSAALVPREGETWRSAVRDNQVLRLDMDSMRSRVNELERECSSMKKVLEKMDRVGGVRPRRVDAGDTGGRGWNSFTRRFGCKFKTQVCDSHERTVVESRRSRAELAMEQPPPPQQLQLQLQREQSL